MPIFFRSVQGIRQKYVSQHRPALEGTGLFSLEQAYDQKTIQSRLSRSLLGAIQLQKIEMQKIASQYSSLIGEKMEVTLKVAGNVIGVFFRGTIESIANAIKMSGGDESPLLDIQNLTSENAVVAKLLLDPYELVLFERFFRLGSGYNVVCASEADLKEGKAVIHLPQDTIPKNAWRTYFSHIQSVSWTVKSKLLRPNATTLNQTSSVIESPQRWTMFWQNLVLSLYDYGDYGEFHPSIEIPSVWNLFGREHSINIGLMRALAMGYTRGEAP